MRDLMGIIWCLITFAGLIFVAMRLVDSTCPQEIGWIGGIALVLGAFTAWAIWEES